MNRARQLIAELISQYEDKEEEVLPVLPQRVHGDPLAPHSLGEFIGQARAVNQIYWEIIGAQKESRLPRHVLALGPPGLGKSSLGEVLAITTGLSIFFANGPDYDTPQKTRETMLQLSRYPPFLWILDEIDGMRNSASYLFHSLMTNGLFYNNGEAIQMPPVCIYGTTNHIGAVPRALRSRFSLRLSFDFYAPDELAQIAQQSATRLNLVLESDAARFIGENSGGEPRRTNQILRTCKNIQDHVNLALANKVMDILELFPEGLTRLQFQILGYLIKNRKGAGLNTIAAALGEDTKDLQTEHEAYLLRKGYIIVGRSGRQITEEGINYLLRLGGN